MSARVGKCGRSVLLLFLIGSTVLSDVTMKGCVLLLLVVTCLLMLLLLLS